MKTEGGKSRPTILLVFTVVILTAGVGGVLYTDTTTAQDAGEAVFIHDTEISNTQPNPGSEFTVSFQITNLQTQTEYVDVEVQADGDTVWEADDTRSIPADGSITEDADITIEDEGEYEITVVTDRGVETTVGTVSVLDGGQIEIVGGSLNQFDVVGTDTEIEADIELENAGDSADIQQFVVVTPFNGDDVVEFTKSLNAGESDTVTVSFTPEDGNTDMADGGTHSLYVENANNRDRNEYLGVLNVDHSPAEVVDVEIHDDVIPTGGTMQTTVTFENPSDQSEEVSASIYADTDYHGRVEVGTASTTVSANSEESVDIDGTISVGGTHDVLLDSPNRYSYVGEIEVSDTRRAMDRVEQIFLSHIPNEEPEPQQPPPEDERDFSDRLNAYEGHGSIQATVDAFDDTSAIEEFARYNDYGMFRTDGLIEFGGVSYGEYRREQVEDIPAQSSSGHYLLEDAPYYADRDPERQSGTYIQELEAQIIGINPGSRHIYGVPNEEAPPTMVAERGEIYSHYDYYIDDLPSNWCSASVPDFENVDGNRTLVGYERTCYRYSESVSDYRTVSIGDTIQSGTSNSVGGDVTTYSTVHDTHTEARVEAEVQIEITERARDYYRPVNGSWSAVGEPRYNEYDSETVSVENEQDVVVTDALYEDKIEVNQLVIEVSDDRYHSILSFEYEEEMFDENVHDQFLWSTVEFGEGEVLFNDWRTYSAARYTRMEEKDGSESIFHVVPGIGETEVEGTDVPYQVGGYTYSQDTDGPLLETTVVGGTHTGTTPEIEGWQATNTSVLSQPFAPRDGVEPPDLEQQSPPKRYDQIFVRDVSAEAETIESIHGTEHTIDNTETIEYIEPLVEIDADTDNGEATIRVRDPFTGDEIEGKDMQISFSTEETTANTGFDGEATVDLPDRTNIIYVTVEGDDATAVAETNSDKFYGEVTARKSLSNYTSGDILTNLGLSLFAAFPFVILYFIWRDYELGK